MACLCGETQTIDIQQIFKDGTKHIRQNCKKCFHFIGFKESVSDDDFVMPMGAHRGKKMTDLPKEYLQWMMGSTLGNNLKNRAHRILMRTNKEVSE